MQRLGRCALGVFEDRRAEGTQTVNLDHQRGIALGLAGRQKPSRRYALDNRHVAFAENETRRNAKVILIEALAVVDEDKRPIGELLRCAPALSWQLLEHAKSQTCVFAPNERRCFGPAGITKCSGRTTPNRGVGWIAIHQRFGPLVNHLIKSVVSAKVDNAVRRCRAHQTLRYMSHRIYGAWSYEAESHESDSSDKIGINQ